MTTVRIVVHEIETGPKNVAGGRTITLSGLMPNKELGHCALTFENTAELEKLRAAIAAP